MTKYVTRILIGLSILLVILLIVYGFMAHDPFAYFIRFISVIVIILGVAYVLGDVFLSDYEDIKKKRQDKIRKKKLEDK